MKKVRYALGALGLVGVGPVVGLVTPTAAAAATDTQKATKTVSLNHSNIAPAVGCIGNTAARNHSANFDMSAWHTVSTGCIGGVSGGRLAHSPGTSMRTRIYTINGTTKTKVFEGFAHVKSSPNAHYRQEVHHVYGGSKQQVCTAVVDASHHSDIFAGPLCVTFPS